MKIVLWIIVAISTLTARAELLFRGYAFTDNNPEFSLSISSETSKWVKLGDVFEGNKILSFDPHAETLRIEKNGATSELRLIRASIEKSDADAHLVRLRTLKGMELAYEVAKDGDPQLLDLLKRQQEASHADQNDPGRNQSALQYLTGRVEGLAAQIAAKKLKEK